MNFLNKKANVMYTILKHVSQFEMLNLEALYKTTMIKKDDCINVCCNAFLVNHNCYIKFFNSMYYKFNYFIGRLLLD